ncbi:glycine oxidase ThiO [Microbacterium halophytorum]|uniref:glycine oxidase ThiO n=1 Tax=Microbacterium halophytorum TaxID=2067568 RepID=UPI00157216DB|nr:glycine oxidase ThiO [Microbacterium halophytorum]
MIVGAGIIGLAVAWELARAGRGVLVVDPEPASGATHAAAGMIAPVSEHRHTEPALHALAAASVARYPGFLASLPGGDRCGFEAAETLLLAVDEADRRMLDDAAALHPDAAVPLSLRETRRAEPMIGPRATAARRVAEHRVDPRALAARMREALGARVVRRSVVGVSRGEADDAPVTGVLLADGSTIAAAETVIACGSGAAALGGLPFEVPLRRVHGDVLRLRVPERLRPLLSRTVRARVRSSSVYLVPRADGTVVVGATEREHGGDGVSAGGVCALLRDAAEVVPAVAELELIEVTARARPVSPDNGPLLGRAGPGLVFATGFGRHGVMLAPIAADAVRTALEGGSDPLLAPFRPDRFTGRPTLMEVS